MARIKFTGYIDINDLEDDQYDADSETGLSAQGYDDFTGHESRTRLCELEDLEVELIK